MDYERIEKPQGGNAGGFSPGKLRNMLLGGGGVEKEKKRKQEEEIDASLSFASTLTSSSRSQHQQQQQQLPDSDSCDNCKDVDVVVSVLPDPECSTSSTADSSLPAQMMISDRRLKDQSRARSQQDYSLDYETAHDGIFEFERQQQQRHQLPVAPFSKPAPSKWDDAQKWIASPNSNRPRNQAGGVGSGGRKVGGMSRQSSTKVVVEVQTDHAVPAPAPAYEEPDTKRIDTSQAKKFVSWEAKPVLMIENSVAESAINLSRHDSSLAIQSATTFIPPPSTARSVSMRDMGTEMTPIASQEPSRTGTPVRATTPIRSPTSSRPSTPGRTAPAPSPTNPPNHHLDFNNDLSEEELQMKTRREIMVLGTQLGKMNIAAWASKEEEDKDASTSLKIVTTEQPTKSVIETRAAAWEEAEKAKYMARFKREEMKIQAWENHQKAKTEAEMRKIEVEVERMRGRAHDKLMNKLAAARHKAEEKRAAAEAKRNRQAAKTEQQTEYIRRTGRIPSSFSCWSWCS